MPILDNITLLLRFSLELIPLLIKWFFTDEQHKKDLISTMKNNKEDK